MDAIRNLRNFAVAICWLAAVGAVAGAERVLFDRQFDLKNIIAQDAVISQMEATEGQTLRVVTGVRQPWPGIVFRAPRAWDLSEYASVAVMLRNGGERDVRMNCRVDNPGADGTKNCVTDSLVLAPGKSGVLNVTLKRAGDGKLDGKLFGMRGYPAAPGGSGTVDPRNITQVLLFVNKPAVSHAFEVQGIRAVGRYAPPTASVTDATPFFPFIDTFGQYKHRDWPGKVHSLVELAGRRAAEAEEITAQPGPADWDQYGAGRRDQSSKQQGSSASKNMPANGGSSIPKGGCSGRTASIACAVSTRRPSTSARIGSRISPGMTRSCVSLAAAVTR